MVLENIDEPRLLGSVQAVPGAPSLGMPIPIEQLGAPGVRANIYISPVFRESTGREKDCWRDCSERSFSIRALLAKQQISMNNIKGSFTKADGTSYLLVSADKNALKGGTPGGEFQIETNDARELSVVTMKILATNPTEARNKFLRSIYPLFDYISYVFNVPIFFSTIHIVDNKNSAQVIEYVSPFRTSTINDLCRSFVGEMLPIYAMDGLTGMKARAIKKAKKEYISFILPEERVPEHENIAQWIRPYVGKSIKEFKDKVLTKQYRDAVAHFTLTDGRRLHVRT